MTGLTVGRMLVSKRLDGDSQLVQVSGQFSSASFLFTDFDVL